MFDSDKLEYIVSECISALNGILLIITISIVRSTKPTYIKIISPICYITYLCLVKKYKFIK